MLIISENIVPQNCVVVEYSSSAGDIISDYKESSGNYT